MTTILIMIVLAVIVALVLNYKQVKKETHTNTPVDNTPTPVEDESVKPGKPKVE